MTRRYITYDLELFDIIKANMSNNFTIREVKENYIQTTSEICIVNLGHNIIEPAVYDEDGNELTSAVYSEYIMLDILGDYTLDGLTEVFPITPNHNFS